MERIDEPAAGEYDEYFEGYVARARGSDVFALLGRQAGALRGLEVVVGEDRAGYRYGPGKWSIREVVGHCSDAERVFAYRALSFARGATAPLPGFDEKEFTRASGHDGLALAELVEEFEIVRSATLHLLRHLPADAWSRAGVANGKPITVRALAFIMAGHVEHHLAGLRARYGVAV